MGLELRYDGVSSRLSITNPTAPLLLQVHNMYGKIVCDQALPTGGNEVKPDHLDSGIYLVTVSGEQALLCTIKVFKNQKNQSSLTFISSISSCKVVTPLYSFSCSLKTISIGILR